MSLMQIDLSKYPYLEMLFRQDPNKLKEILPQFIQLADWYGDEAPKQVFNMPMYEFIKLQAEIFFDWKGPLVHHHSPGEAKALEILEEENHPLQVFKGKSPAYDAEGNKLSLGEYTTSEDIADFMKSILYALRFGSQKDLVNYMLLKDYDLVDNLKAHNVQQLLKVQPALECQKDNSIPIGKRIPRTGFFDLGEITNDGDDCPSCKWDNTLKAFGDYIICSNCKGGFKNV